MAGTPTPLADAPADDTPKTYRLLKDGAMVSKSLGWGEDLRGKPQESTVGEVGYAGDEYDNLSKALLDRIEAGELGDTYELISQEELDERDPDLAKRQAQADAAEDDGPQYADVKEYTDLDVKVLKAITEERSTQVEGSGKDGAIVKQDYIKALIAQDKDAV